MAVPTVEIPQLSITGYVFNDANGNNFRDDGETVHTRVDMHSRQCSLIPVPHAPSARASFADFWFISRPTAQGGSARPKMMGA